jgi:hypothetical protein
MGKMGISTNTENVSANGETQSSGLTFLKQLAAPNLTFA